MIKPLSRLVSGIPGVAGSTILDDGRVALILDVAALLRRAAARPWQSAARTARPKVPS